MVPNIPLHPIPDRPGMLDMKGKAKWDAWDSKRDQNFTLVESIQQVHLKSSLVSFSTKTN